MWDVANSSNETTTKRMHQNEFLKDARAKVRERSSEGQSFSRTEKQWRVLQLNVYK